MCHADACAPRHRNTLRPCLLPRCCVLRLVELLHIMQASASIGGLEGPARSPLRSDGGGAGMKQRGVPKSLFELLAQERPQGGDSQVVGFPALRGPGGGVAGWLAGTRTPAAQHLRSLRPQGRWGLRWGLAGRPSTHLPRWQRPLLHTFPQKPLRGSRERERGGWQPGVRREAGRHGGPRAHAAVHAMQPSPLCQHTHQLFGSTSTLVHSRSQMLGRLVGLQGGAGGAAPGGGVVNACSRGRPQQGGGLLPCKYWPLAKNACAGLTTRSRR